MTNAETRGERRRARTRQALIDAARAVLAGERAAMVSIREITDTADVGFGSFYNHFTSKDELYGAAVEQVLDELGERLDELGAADDDPAEAFARSVRITAGLVGRDPQAARILVQHGIAHLDSARGLAPRALRDIERGVELGRFRVGHPHLALASTAGALIGLLQLALRRPDLVGPDAGDEIAEQLLRMLGLGVEESAEIVRHPLPDLGTRFRDAR